MRVGIFGAGIAGLSSAYLLKDTYEDIKIFEASDIVGGLARSFKWHGFDCDIAPHRLFTNDEELLADLLALTPMLEQRRMSRIFIRDKWIADPVNAVEMVLKFRLRDSIDIVWNYLFKKKGDDKSFEDLVLSQFGSGLNRVFFKPYSEKLFGIPADQISAAWGRRKIRVAGLKDMLRRNSKLYFKKFYYPKENGYGAICDAMGEAVGDKIQRNTTLTGVSFDNHNGPYRCTFERDGQTFEEEFDLIVNSIPISVFTRMLGLNLNFQFREAKVCYLLVDKPNVTNNHWFYFADYDPIINRVAEFKNFNDTHCPKDKTVICCEVTRTEDFSVDAVIENLESAGLLKKEEVLDSMVIPIRQAYPIYDLDYEDNMVQAEAFLSAFENVFMIGRHAQFTHKDVDEIFDEAKKLKAELLERGRKVMPSQETVADA